MGQRYAMIAPILPGAQVLAQVLAGKVDYFLVDRMNYNYSDVILSERSEQKISEILRRQAKR